MHHKVRARGCLFWGGDYLLFGESPSSLVDRHLDIREVSYGPTDAAHLPTRSPMRANRTAWFLQMKLALPSPSAIIWLKRQPSDCSCQVSFSLPRTYYCSFPVVPAFSTSLSKERVFIIINFFCILEIWVLYFMIIL